MFALRSHAIVRRRTHARCFWAEFYQHLTPATNQFLDLAIALPFPPSFPPYASTILLGTVLLRLAFLPTVLWSRRKVVRMEQAQKDVDRLLPAFQRQEFQAMQKQGIRGHKQFLIDTHRERVNTVMTQKFNQLIQERNCDPKWTIPVSVLVQAPPYIVFSIILSCAAADPLTPFRSESFLTLTSLAHPDPTITMPIVLGIISMANVDTRNWWLTLAEREKEKKFHEWKATKAERQGKPYIKSPLKNIMRGLSIARIGLAMLVPGGVQLYWVASAGCGFVQTIVFDWIDSRRRQRQVVQETLAKKVSEAPTTKRLSNSPSKN